MLGLAMSTIYKVLSFVGLLFIAAVLFQSLRFIVFYSRSASLERYRQGEESWAIVTGGGGGIGFGFSRELCRQGFNVILVGHLATELRQAEQKLRQETPSAKIRQVLLDATTADYDEILRAMSDVLELPVTILINNVGGGQGVAIKQDFKEFASHTAEEIDRLMNLNTRFMVYLTRIMLPTLTRANQRSLIINMSSAAKSGYPYTTLYSASKAFVAIFTRSLDMELRAEGHQNIKLVTVVPGDVRSDGHQVPLSFYVPSAEVYARVALSKVSFAPSIVSPYWPQALLLGLADSLPDRLLEKPTVDRIRRLKGEFQRLR